MPTSAKRTPRPRAAEPAAPDILHALGDEHKYQARLLNLLEKQVGLLNQKLPADLEVMAGVMRYMTRYPDRFHHPKEDLLFEKIVLRDAAAKPRVDELLQAHETILGQGAELLAAIEQCQREGPGADTHALRKAAHAYIGSLRRHMDIEHLHLFPLAQKVLKAEDWADVDMRMKPILDPVFGTTVTEEFRPLHEAEAAKPDAGSPGQLGMALIEAAALIETVATLIAGAGRLRRQMIDHQREVSRVNRELMRSLIGLVPEQQRRGGVGELLERNWNLLADNHNRMLDLWSQVWSAAWRPYEEAEGPYAPRLLRRRRRKSRTAANN